MQFCPDSRDFHFPLESIWLFLFFWHPQQVKLLGCFQTPVSFKLKNPFQPLICRSVHLCFINKCHAILPLDNIITGKILLKLIVFNIQQLPITFTFTFMFMTFELSYLEVGWSYWWEGCQANDHSLRPCFNISKCENCVQAVFMGAKLGVFNKTLGNLQLCLCWPEQVTG